MYWPARQNRIFAINTQRDINTVYRRYSVFSTSNMVLKTAVFEILLKKMTCPYFQTKFKITMIG
jgi:hypothetical protein